ncbi:hypothetical protein U1707_11760 [Sphingomonas sp. PB2P12]|uniref:hypothetical protein n=1 Tax=Sphingomonas sandaracina TaxID=3096157 RepID=UPI002FCABCFB
MNGAHLGATLLVLAGCAPGSASAINPSDDLHCAVVIRTLERNADQLGASPTAKKGLYVLQTWYFSKIKRERLEEARGVLEATKKYPAEVSSVGQKCSDRAFSDPSFTRWMSVASDDYDRKAMR